MEIGFDMDTYEDHTGQTKIATSHHFWKFIGNPNSIQFQLIPTLTLKKNTKYEVVVLYSQQLLYSSK